MGKRLSGTRDPREASREQIRTEFAVYKERGVSRDQMVELMRPEIERLHPDEENRERTKALWHSVIDDVWGKR